MGLLQISLHLQNLQGIYSKPLVQLHLPFLFSEVPTLSPPLPLTPFPSASPWESWVLALLQSLLDSIGAMEFHPWVVELASDAAAEVDADLINRNL